MSGMSVRLSRGAWITLAVALLLGAAALAPGALGVAHGQTAGPPPTPTPTPQGPPAPTTTTVPPSGGSSTNPTAQVTITIPALGRPVTVVILPVVPPGTGTAQQQATLVRQTLQGLGIPVPLNANGTVATVVQLFDLDATFTDTNTEVGTFARPVTISVDVSAEGRALAGGSFANLTLAFFDTTTGTWVPVPCAPSPAGIDCVVTHFSLWALIVRPAALAGPPAAAPPSAAPRPAATGYGSDVASAGGVSGLTVAALATVVVLGMSGAGALAFARRRRS